MKTITNKVCKAALALTLFFVSAFSMAIVDVNALEVNLALNKAVVASAQYSTLPASYLTDGDTNTRWSSEAKPVQWAYVDLGQSYEFSKFQMTWESNAEYATKYNIYVSNDTENWGEAVIQRTDNTAQTSEDVLEEAVSGRYVKLEIIAVSNYPSVSCREFKIIQVKGNTSTQHPAENVALNKTAVASSIEADSVRASNAVDGDTSSRTSRWGSNVGNGPHWIYVDLGREMDVNVVKVFWENRKATNYKIQIATTLSETMSESDWQTVKEFSERPDTVDEKIVLDQVYTARYVRLYITSHTSADPDGGVAWNSVSIYEMEIYGGDVEPQDPTENVALNKTAVANGVEDNAPSLAADKAVDGNESTRWASPVANAPHWIYVDLGETKDIQVIKLLWWERKATNYEIQISDDASEGSWTTVKTLERPDSKKEKIVLDDVYRARYIRVYINAFDKQDPDGTIEWNNVSINEIEVYGGDPDVIPTLDEALDMIEVEVPQKGDKKLVIHYPDVAEYGYELKYNGTDYEQVIGDDLTIYQPISDMNVKVSFKGIDTNKETQGENKNYKFKEVTLTVPGQYAKEDEDNEAPQILPELREWKGHSGTFSVAANGKIIIANKQLQEVAEAFATDYHLMTGKTLSVVEGRKDDVKTGDFYFELTSDHSLGLQDEGYLMDISEYVTVKSETATGAYWATRTVLQSLKQTGNVPCGVTRDYPLYPVRGFILDVGRKTFTMDYLKQVAQQMAWYKMNDLQIHLNDNLIPLENLHPNEMDAYSAFRLESDIKKGGNNGLNQADLTSTDVFYTKQEFKDFIKEARIWGVNIVPEIDTPAHSLALTKVRPDLRLGTSGRQNDHLNLTSKYEESLEFVQEIFSEYMTGKDPVFDDETIIHVGADEYSANQSAYVRFAKDMIAWVKETGRTARVWGSLTQSRKSGADVTQMKEVSENVQINLWNYGWANIDEMYDLGFDLINCNDGNYYIVPNAGYYYDYLNDGTLYNLDINTIGGFTVPAGDKQMVGGAFAVWNDMTDYLENGVSEYDVYDRIKNAIPLFGAKLWGKGNYTLNQANALRNELGEAPQVNFGYNVESKGDDIAHYTMDSLNDSSLNQRHLSQGVNANIEEVDGRKALLLNGKESYVTTPLTTVGLGNDLRVKVKRISSSQDDQILFESPYGSIKAVQKGTGKVGFSRENRDYSFNYELPINEWVELEFKNEKNITKLYVNGVLVDILGDDEKAAENKKLLATTMFPVERIGSQTNAFIGYVDDIRLGKVNDFSSTMVLDKAVIKAQAILVEKDNTKLVSLIDDAKDIFAKYDPSQEEINSLAQQINDILNDETYAKADYTRVDGYLELIRKDFDLTMFTDSSVAYLNAIIDSVQFDLPVMMQEVVDGYAMSIEGALSQLELKTKLNVNYIANSRLKVTASSYQDNSAHPNKVLDGDKSTMWHTQWSITTMPHWIAFELDEKARINGMTYTPRSGAGNGTLTKYKVQVSDNGIDWRDIKEGTLARNDQDKEILFDTVETKYIRLYYVEAVGNFGSAAEIKLHDASVVADIDGLKQLIAKVEEIENVGYTEESWNELQSSINSAKAIISTQDAEEVEVAKRDLTDKALKLQLNDNVQNINKKALLTQINAAKDVTDEVLKTVIGSVVDEFKSALSDAQDGLYDTSAVQKTVDDLLERLANALKALETSVVDKAPLQAYVNANSSLVEADYTADTWQEYANALKNAQEVLSNRNSNQNDIDQAYASLQTAVKSLKQKPVIVDPEPVDPIDPEEPVAPVEPTEPTPEEPIAPGNPVQPTRPANPVVEPTPQRPVVEEENEGTETLPVEEETPVVEEDTNIEENETPQAGTRKASGPNMMLIGGGIVVVLGLLWILLAKRKKEQED